MSPNRGKGRAMGRLVEVQNAHTCPSPLTIRPGDILQFHASGGRVRSGDAVEPIGPLLTAVLGDNGAIFAPVGEPNIVLFRALGAGEALIEVVTGDPWSSPRVAALRIIVAA